MLRTIKRPNQILFSKWVSFWKYFIFQVCIVNNYLCVWLFFFTYHQVRYHSLSYTWKKNKLVLLSSYPGNSSASRSEMALSRSSVTIGADNAHANVLLSYLETDITHCTQLVQCSCHTTKFANTTFFHVFILLK